MNVVATIMEINFVVSKRLEMLTGGGEFGPTELELSLTTIFCTIGYFGPEFF